MKIFCIGRNYAAHAAELNNAVPTEPIVFLKPDTAVLRDGKVFYIPDFSSDIHHEIEIVLKISKRGKYIEQKFAHRYYDEIGLGIDFTARSLQEKLKANGHPWEISKAFDQSAVVGDFLDKGALGSDIRNIDFLLNINGITRQKGNTSQLIFDFDALIVYISRFFTLSVGDLIYTGTPSGVGAVQIGDSLEGYMNGKMMLYCPVR